MPRTRYFKILGRADCDDWVVIDTLFMTPDKPARIKSNPEYYLGGGFRDHEPHTQCLGLFAKKFKAGDDERLAGADGVVFDGDSYTITKGTNGLPIGNIKVFMRGWAIKFVDPTPEDLKTLLSKRPGQVIDVLQLKAGLFWIEQHRATEYATAIRALIPKHELVSIEGWNEVNRELLEALATLDPAAGDASFWMGILAAGVEKTKFANPDNPVSARTGGDAPRIAGNILACSGDLSLVPELERIAYATTVYQHKLAAAKALAALGRPDVATKIGQRIRHDRWQAITQGDPMFVYTCPYRSRSAPNGAAANGIVNKPNTSDKEAL